MLITKLTTILGIYVIMLIFCSLLSHSIIGIIISGIIGLYIGWNITNFINWNFNDIDIPLEEQE